MDTLRQYQLRCPDDIGIVTADDHPWREAFSPRLTTINQPNHEIGHRSAELLVEALAGDEVLRRQTARTVTLPTSSRIHASCGSQLRPGHPSHMPPAPRVEETIA
jgi:DNA-binding LacI/PurR family transcriptional regulator